MSDDYSSQSPAALNEGPGGEGNQNYSNFEASVQPGQKYQMVEVSGQVLIDPSVAPSLVQAHESGVGANVLVLALKPDWPNQSGTDPEWVDVEFGSAVKASSPISQVEILNPQLGNLTIQVD